MSRLAEVKKLLQLKALRDDPHAFVFGIDPITGNPYVYTTDPHDRDVPVKPMPDLPHLRAIVEAWLAVQGNILSIPKSRQVMVTWIMVAVHLWLAMFHEEQRIFVISKNRESATELIHRMKAIYKRLPEWLQEALPLAKAISEMPKTQLIFRHGSSIIALPRGSEQIREYTASAIFVDEAAFVPDLEEVVAAAVPAIAGGGRLTLVSSVYAGTDFEKIARQRRDELIKPILEDIELAKQICRRIGRRPAVDTKSASISITRGVRLYRTPRSIVLEIHYSAWEGARHKAEQARQSLSEAGYLREYEINWDVAGDEVIFRDILEERHHQIIRPAIPLSRREYEEKLYVYGFDWGFVSPSCVLEIVYDPIKDQAIVTWELYEEGLLLGEIVEAISRREFYNHPNCLGVYADPSIFHRRIPKSGWSRGGVGQALIELGLRIHRANIGPAARVQEVLSRLYREGEPGLIIAATCENLITELQNLRWDKRGHEKPDESLPSHAFDALGYGLYGVKWRRVAAIPDKGYEYADDVDNSELSHYDLEARVTYGVMMLNAELRRPIRRGRAVRGIREWLQSRHQRRE